MNLKYKVDTIVSRFFNLLNNRSIVVLLILSIVLYNIIINLLFFIRLYTYKSGAFDLGVFMQSLYSTLNGRFFYEAPDFEMYGVNNFFGVHVSPIMFLMIPVYYLYPSWLSLTVFQSIIVSSSSIYVYKISKHILKNDKLSLFISLIYLFNPLTITANLYDFHLESFIPLFYTSMFYYNITKRYKLLAISTALLLLVIEATYLITFFFALYVLINSFRKNEKLTRSMKIIVLFLLFTPLLLILPGVFSSIYGHPLKLSQYYTNIATFFLGSGIFYNIVPKIVFWLEVLACFGFLPLLSLFELIPIIPYFLVSTLSAYQPYYTVGWQYSFYLIPILITSTIYSIEKMRKIKGSLRIYIPLMSLFIILLNPVAINLQSQGSFVPPSGGYSISLDFSNAISNMYYINNILKEIPNNAVIISSQSLFPFIANNLNSYTMLYIINPYQLKNYYQSLPRSPQYLLINPNDFNPSYLDDISVNNYSTVAEEGDILLLKEGYYGKVLYFSPYSVYLPVSKFYTLPNIIVNKISDLKFGNVLEYIKDEYPNASALWFGPYIGLSRGVYLASFYIKFINISDQTNPLLKIDVNNFPYGPLASRIISPTEVKPGSWEKFNIVFSVLSPGETLEFRGYSLNNNSTILFGGVQVEQISPYPAELFTPCDLDIANGVLIHGNSPFGCYVKVNESVSKGSTIWFGPYITLSKNNYTALFIIRLFNVTNYNKPIITLQITSNLGNEILNNSEVYPIKT